MASISLYSTGKSGGSKKPTQSKNTLAQPYNSNPTKKSTSTSKYVTNMINNGLPQVSGTLASATGTKLPNVSTAPIKNTVTTNPYQGSARPSSVIAPKPSQQITSQVKNPILNVVPSSAVKPKPTTSNNNNNSSSSGGGGGSVGGGSGYIPTPEPQPPVEVRENYKPNWTPELRTADELAKLWGIQIDQDYYSGMLNKGTNEYFNQMNTEMLRAEDNAYDMLAQNYEMTRDDIKQRRQMALSEGATSGQLAAQELAALMGAQQSSGAVATDMLGSYYDLAQQKATTLEENMKLAMQMEQEARAGLGNIANQIYSVDTQRYAADSTALSQITAAEYAKIAQLGAANISANATTAAANASASASKYAADRNAAVQSQLASKQYLNDYFNAQYSNQSKYYPQSTYKK